MKELIDKLMGKYWFKIPYSSIKIFTEQDVRSMILEACEAQRKACLRIAKDFGIEYDSLLHNIEHARITEQDYE